MAAGFRSPLFILGLSVLGGMPPGPPAEEGYYVAKKINADTGSEWRYPLVSLVCLNGAPWTESAYPSALTEFRDGNGRACGRFAGVTRVRLAVNVDNPAPSGTLAAQYSIDSGASWAFFDGASEPAVAVDVAGFFVSGWVTIEDAAKAELWVRLVAAGGDDSASADFGNIYLEVSPR